MFVGVVVGLHSPPTHSHTDSEMKTIIFFIAAFLSVNSAFGRSADEWKSRVIYQVGTVTW